MKESRSIGQRIREKRTGKGITQPSLATRAGISLPFLKKVEGGQASVSAAFLGRIARTLGESADYFLLEVESDEEMAARLWTEHSLEAQTRAAGRFDLVTKKAILKNLGLWKRD